jgi:hypothetical protein
VRLSNFVSPAFATALLVASASASAQTTDPTLLASRRALIDRATAARTAGRHQEALDLAQRAAQIQMTPSLRLFLMQEQTLVGQLAEAYSSAIACQSEAARDTAASAQTIARLCTESVNSLQSRVGRVVVTLAPTVEGARVFVGNRELHAVLLGQDYVVTPGEVSVRAEAPGHRAVSRTVSVAAGASVSVSLPLEREAHPEPTPVRPPDPQSQPANTVVVAPDNAAAASTTAQTITPPPSGRASEPPSSPIVAAGVSPTTDRPRTVNLGAVAMMATGGAIAVGGAVTLGLGAGATTEYDQLCTPRCTQDNVTMGRAAYDRANTMFGIGIAGVAIGGAAAVGGLLWMLVARPSAAPPRVAFVAPTAGGMVIGIGGSL